MQDENNICTWCIKKKTSRNLPIVIMNSAKLSDAINIDSYVLHYNIFVAFTSFFDSENLK